VKFGRQHIEVISELVDGIVRLRPSNGSPKIRAATLHIGNALLNPLLLGNRCRIDLQSFGVELDLQRMVHHAFHERPDHRVDDFGPHRRRRALGQSAELLPTPIDDFAMMNGGGHRSTTVSAAQIAATEQSFFFAIPAR
jgi:hypothetical protein